MNLIPKKNKAVEWIKNKVEEKPVTREELEKLKLQVVKKRLEADIEESKAIIHKSKVERSMRTLNALFGSMGALDPKAAEEREQLRKKTLGY